MTESGWLSLYKTPMLSSNRALCLLRKMFGCKAGYVGTLDPFAQGILPIAIGQSTKFVDYVLASEKHYIFDAIFGITTDTLDVCGTPIYHQKLDTIDHHDAVSGIISNVLQNFLGNISQIPPKYSAIKTNGRRACDIARNGGEVTLSARNVKIFELKLLNIEPVFSTNISNTTINGNFSKISCYLRCSKGTYVRSLVADIAAMCNTVGYVNFLERTKVGIFEKSSSYTLEMLEEIMHTGRKLRDILLPDQSALDDIPALYFGNEDMTSLLCGRRIHCNNAEMLPLFRAHRECDGQFCGICKFVDIDQIAAVRMCC